MDVVFRAIAIFVEVVLLAAIFYFILNGVRLILFDLGLTQKYSRVITFLFGVVGCILLVFFISHLMTFYPTI